MSRFYPGHFSATTVITTGSGVAGGLWKAVSLLQVAPIVLHISIQGCITVTAYAVLSAMSAYLTKKLMDYLFNSTKTPTKDE